MKCLGVCEHLFFSTFFSPPLPVSTSDNVSDVHFPTFQPVQVGKSAESSELEGCKENGWLCNDADVFKGINYKVKYLGSVEVDFDGADSSNNQEHAQKAMRALLAHSKGASQGKIPKLVLQVSVNCIKMLTLDGKKTIMRHSTTRIAYSTVDADNAKLFSYVGMVKGTQLTLCHIFKCKTPKQGYEMTFVCAQAFDLNFRTWQSNRAHALAEAKASEGSDIEPTKAWQKKKSPEEAAAVAAALAGGGGAAAAEATEEFDAPAHDDEGGDGAAAQPAASGEPGEDDVAPPTTRARRTSLVPAEPDAPLSDVERDPVFLSIMEGKYCAMHLKMYMPLSRRHLATSSAPPHRARERERVCVCVCVCRQASSKPAFCINLY